MQHVFRVLIGHFREGTADLQAVVEDNHVHCAERLCRLAGEAFDECFVVEVAGNVEILGLGVV